MVNFNMGIASPRPLRGESEVFTSEEQFSPNTQSIVLPNGSLGPGSAAERFSYEIEHLRVNMSSLAKTLSNGNEDEITLVLFEMREVFQHCHEYAEQTLIPTICKQVMNWSDSLQLSAGEALMTVPVIQSSSEVAKITSNAALNLMRLTKSSGVRNKWARILFSTLPHVAWSPNELLEFIDEVEAGWLSPKHHARILGSISVSSNDEQLKTRIMRKAMHICDDQDVEVRGMIAESLSTIAAAVSVSAVEEELWPCLMKLLKDENARVHAAAMRTLAEIGSAHKQKSHSSTLFSVRIPEVLLRECTKIRSSASEDQRKLDVDEYLLLEINSEIFGKLLYCCFDHLPDDAAKKEAFKAFLAMASCNGPIIRKNCAFNMPAVALCMAKKGRFELSAIVEFLSQDSDPETRWKLAAGLHETVRILAAKDTIGNLFRSVLRLLQDPNALVRMSTLGHLQELIAQLAKYCGYHSVHKLAPIFENLHMLSEGNWRTQKLLAEQLKLAAPLVPPPAIRINVLPLLNRISEEGSHLVRKSAMETIATCIRYVPGTIEREEEMQKFRKSWAQGPVYWMRMAFIDTAEAASKIYSKCLFRDTFGAVVLRLSQDSVPNVRLRLARLLCKIAPACFQMEVFHKALERLKNDTEKDITDVLHGIDQRIEAALKESEEKFEEEMEKEEVEQDLYSAHLQAQLDAQKENGSRKRAKSRFFGKSNIPSVGGTPRSILVSPSAKIPSKWLTAEPAERIAPLNIEAVLDNSRGGQSNESDPDAQGKNAKTPESKTRRKSGIKFALVSPLRRQVETKKIPDHAAYLNLEIPSRSGFVKSKSSDNISLRSQSPSPKTSMSSKTETNLRLPGASSFRDKSKSPPRGSPSGLPNHISRNPMDEATSSDSNSGKAREQVKGINSPKQKHSSLWKSVKPKK